MLVVHGTQAFRSKVPGPPATPGDASSTLLGSWYGTVLRWRRPAVLLVNETTLLPVLLPLAPAKTLLARLPDAVGEVLAALAVPEEVVVAERAAMGEVRVAATANRSVVGVMGEFARNADWRRDRDGDADLLELAVDLSRMPCRPLSSRHGSPDLELAAAIESHRTGKPIPTRSAPLPPRPPAAPRQPQPSPRGGFGAGLRRSTPEPPRGLPEVRHRPGLADELMRELAPLLAEDGIDLDDPPELPVLQAALSRAVERRNLDLFTPVGSRRVAASAVLMLFAAAVDEDRSRLAAGLLDQVVPESKDDAVAEVSAVIGMALALLDHWYTGQHPNAPHGLAAAARLPAWQWTGKRAATEILALAARGRAFTAHGALIARHGGHDVLTGAALAVTAAAQAWARSTSTPLGQLLPDIVR